MDFKEYQLRAMDTAIYPGKGEIVGLMYTALGLGEAGEVQGKVKKILRDSGGIVTPEAREAIVKECGDVIWYVAAMCSELGVSMNDVAVANLAKLKMRQEKGVIGGSGDNRERTEL